MSLVSVLTEFVFPQLRYLRGRDWLLLCAGTCFAVVHGICFPLITLILGHMTDILLSQAEQVCIDGTTHCLAVFYCECNVCVQIFSLMKKYKSGSLPQLNLLTIWLYCLMYLLLLNSSISNITGSRLESWGLIPGTGREFSHCYHIQTGSGAHWTSYPVTLGVKGSVCDYDLPPSSIKWNFASTISLHGIVLRYRDICTFSSPLLSWIKTLFQRCNSSNSSLSYLSQYDEDTDNYEELSIENLLQNTSSGFVNPQQLLDIFR
jgi:hypothetical protein